MKNISEFGEVRVLLVDELCGSRRVRLLMYLWYSNKGLIFRIRCEQSLISRLFHAYVPARRGLFYC